MSSMSLPSISAAEQSVVESRGVVEDGSGQGVSGQFAPSW